MQTMMSQEERTNILCGDLNKVMVDKQQNKMYKWDREVVDPHDTNLIPFNQIECIVEYIWKSEGLKFPPKVEELPKSRYRSAFADATRLEVRFREHAYTKTILHELAHSMTSDLDGESNMHGALFMGVYIHLLHRYLGLEIKHLVDTALEYGLKVNLDARPIF